MRLGNLTLRVLQQIGHIAMQNARSSAIDRRSMPPTLHAIPGGFDTDELYALIVQERMEDADGV